MDEICTKFEYGVLQKSDISINKFGIVNENLVVKHKKRENFLEYLQQYVDKQYGSL